MAAFTINAKHPGKCSNCNTPFEPGFQITLDKKADGKSYVVRCAACPDDKDARRDARVETDAGLRSSLPKTYQDYLARCGTLREAIESLNALGEQMRAQLRSHNRSLEDLLIAAIDATVSSSMLQTCDPASWASALRACCALGVIPDPGMGPAALAWFVPRGGKVSLDQSYRNFCNLAFNSPAFKKHNETVVYECERILGSIVFLQRSSKKREQEAGDRLVVWYQTDPRAFEGVSAWDREVVLQAFSRPDGLVWAWFHYQESPEHLIHQRPDWFREPEWTRTSPLPWGVYADATLRGGGHGIAVLTREECYKRAVKGGNVRFVQMLDGSIRLGTKWAKPAEGNRESQDNGWVNTAWCAHQAEMLKKTAIRDLMTGGRVPITVRMQVAMAAEVAEGDVIEGEVVTVPSTLDDHLRSVARRGAPDTHQIEEAHDEVPDFAAETERLAESKVGVPVNASVEALQEFLADCSEAQIDDAFKTVGIPFGVPVEELNGRERDRLWSALGGGR